MGKESSLQNDVIDMIRVFSSYLTSRNNVGLLDSGCSLLSILAQMPYKLC